MLTNSLKSLCITACFAASLLGAVSAQELATQQSSGGQSVESPAPATTPSHAGGANPAHLSAAYTASINTILPMSPEDIADLHRRVDRTNRASALTGAPPPRQITRSMQLSTDPGTTPPAICVRRGYGSSLVFLDSTGAPWPVVGYMVGDPTAYTVTQPAVAESNILNISPTTAYGTTNVTVSLANNPVPVIIVMSAKENATRVDGVVTAMVAGRGPRAKAPVFSAAPAPATSLDMMAILDGVPPQNAIALQMSGINGDAWRIGDRMYVRTKTPVRSPASFALVSGPNNIRVYELPLVPVLLASEQGATVTVHIRGQIGG